MKMTVEFDSLSEARQWASDLLGYQEKPASKTFTSGTKVSEAPTKVSEAPTKEPADAKPDGFKAFSVKGLGRRQKEVVDYLTASPVGETVTTKDVATALGIASPNASNILSTLRSERGMTESPKRGQWRLVPGVHKQALASDSGVVEADAAPVETDAAPVEEESAEDTPDEEVLPQTPDADYENILDGLEL